MSRLEKLGNVVEAVGAMVMGAGFLYISSVVGTSDLEQYTHEYHSLGWTFSNLFIGLVIFILGACLIKVSEKVIELSHKKFRRVWVRNTVSDEVTLRLIEVGEDIILSDDEVIYKVSRKLYRFR